MRFLIRRDSLKRAVRWAGSGLIASGILVLGCCLVVHLQRMYFQVREAHTLSQRFRAKANGSEIEPAPKFDAQRSKQGAVIGQIDIPRLGLSTIVVEGTESRDLTRAAGHVPGTAFPGRPGNTGIAAHRDTLFRPLRWIQNGDAVFLKTSGAIYSYRVVSTAIVAPEDIQVLYPTARESLTLVTCYPFNYIGSAPQRFIVRAERKSQ